MTFQKRLRDLRKERGETQVQVSAALGIADRHYQRFEAGMNLPSFSNLWALADHFQVNMDYLVGRTDVRDMLPPAKEEAEDGTDT